MILQLRGGNWIMLQSFIDYDPPTKSGGYQSRAAKWRDNINPSTKSITLDDDDIDWIKRQIINQHGGGWQKRIAVIFAGQCSEFTRLPILPSKRRTP